MRSGSLGSGGFSSDGFGGGHFSSRCFRRSGFGDSSRERSIGRLAVFFGHGRADAGLVGLGDGQEGRVSITDSGRLEEGLERDALLLEHRLGRGRLEGGFGLERGEPGNVRRFHRDGGRQHTLRFFQVQRHRNKGLRQGIAKLRGARGKLGEVRHHGARALQSHDHFAYRAGRVGHQGDAVVARRALAGQRTLHEALHRRGDVGERDDLGHRERAVHRVDGAQQLVIHRLRTAGAAGVEPGVHGLEMPGDFGLEDLEQHRIDREASVVAVVGRHSFGGERRHRLGLEGSGLDGRHGLGRCRRRCSELDGLVEHFLAGSDAPGKLLDAFEVGMHRLALQRRTQQRKGVECVLDQGNHRRAGAAGPFEHAVERALDLPAEFAQRLGADQPAAALERVEHAADRPQLLHVVGLPAPGGQELLEAADLFLEFLQEHFADLVVDLIAGTVEARDDREAGRGGLPVARPGHGGARSERGYRGGQIGRHVERGRQLDHPLGDGLRPGFDDRRRHGCGNRHGGRFGHRRRRCDGRGRFGGRGSANGSRAEVFGRKRPIAERLEVLPGHVEDLVALGTAVAQRLEVVLKAGKRVGEAVHLLAVGHATAAQQFVFGEAAHGTQILGRVLQLEYAQCAGHFFHQARHVGQLRVVPVGFHEGDEALARLGEVGDRFLHQHLQHLAGLSAGQDGFVGRGGAGNAVVGFAKAGHLVVERSFHVKKRASNVEQARLVGDALAADDGLDGGALVLDHAARDAQAQHAQGVGHPVESLHLVVQVAGGCVRGAQVQVERVLDAQQILLDGHGDRSQQGAVAATEAAAGVRQFGFAGQVLAQAEHGADLADAAVVCGRVRHEVQQLSRELQRRVGAERGVATFGQALDLALDLGQRLLERLGGFEGILGQRVERAGGNPEQAARVLGVGDRHQLFAHVGEVADGGRAVVVLEPAQQGTLEQVAQRFRAALELLDRKRRGRAGGTGRQRARQVGREQHRLRKTLLAARLAQLVEQRQQHDGDVAVAALQTLEIVGQLHDAAHQRRVAGFTFGHPVLDQGAGQLLHLLGHHGGAVELDHAQRSLHLVQVSDAGLELAGILALLDVRLQRLASLAQRLVELGLDPSERGEIDVLVKPHAKVLSGHGRLFRRPRRRVANDPPAVPGISPAA